MHRAYATFFCRHRQFAVHHGLLDGSSTEEETHSIGEYSQILMPILQNTAQAKQMKVVEMEL
jgi:hypothetical protein